MQRTSRTNKPRLALANLGARLPDATIPIASHLALEAAIEAQPDQRANYLVYADALEQETDPRGGLIVLHSATIERPDDPALWQALRAYIEEHESYLLGDLVSSVRTRAVRVTWYMGYLRSIRIGSAPTERVIELLDVIARLPSCRFLRELVVERDFQLDARAVTAQLVLLARPTTLAQIDIRADGWTSTDELEDAFPRLGEPIQELGELVADARAITVAGEIDWCALSELSEWQVRLRLATVIDRPEPRTGIVVDPLVLVSGGACTFQGGRVDDLVVPDRESSVVVDGDLVVDGVFELPTRSSMIVFGNLECRALCTDGYLVILGDLVVGDIGYGCSTSDVTIVFGSLRAGSLLFDRNHQLAVHGAISARRRLRDGAEISAYLAERRLLPTSSLDASTLAAALRNVG